MYDKLKIHWSTVKKGKNSDIGSITRPMTKEEQDKISDVISYYYTDFVNKVAKARDMSYDEVDKIAQGQVWTGKQAKDNKLIDEIGGIAKATEIIKEKLQTKAEIELVNVIKKRDGLEIYVDFESMSSNIPLYYYISKLQEYDHYAQEWLEYGKDKAVLRTLYDLKKLSEY